MIWAFAIILASVYLVFVYLIPHFIVDPSYSPRLKDFTCEPSCRKGGDFILLILFLFLSLPVLLKALATGSAISEVLTRWVAYVVWTFDRRPDFAIGPNGIYGVSGLRYRHISWANIYGAVCKKTETIFGTQQSLQFQTNVKHQKSWLSFGREPSNITIVLAPIHGFDLDEIRMLTGHFAPNLKIQDVGADLRPWWLRW